jgi:hypothetical protein
LDRVKRNYQFDEEDYGNELRFHLQYALFSERQSSGREYMTFVFEDIIHRFLNQSGKIRALYASQALGKDVT